MGHCRHKTCRGAWAHRERTGARERSWGEEAAARPARVEVGGHGRRGRRAVALGGGGGWRGRDPDLDLGHASVGEENGGEEDVRGGCQRGGGRRRRRRLEERWGRRGRRRRRAWEEGAEQADGVGGGS